MGEQRKRQVGRQSACACQHFPFCFLSFSFSDHLIPFLRHRTTKKKWEQITQRSVWERVRDQCVRKGGRGEENGKRRENDQVNTTRRRREMGSGNNGEWMMLSSRRKGGGSGLTFCWRQSAGERVDKDAMWLLEEVRRNKSTEKKICGSTSGTRQEVAIYHFSEVTNVALRLSPCFLFFVSSFFNFNFAMALLPYQAPGFVFKGMYSE